jgi:GGDEF domain-containing protein
VCTVRVPLTTFRQSDAIGRLGGDEFVAMLTDSNKYTVGEMLARFAGPWPLTRLMRI